MPKNAPTRPMTSSSAMQVTGFQFFFFIMFGILKFLLEFFV